MRWLAAVLVLAFACGLPAWGQTRDENAQRCETGDPDMRIAGCTALIQSGQEPNENLINAYRHRGYAYYAKGNVDRAIQDYDQVIRLNPSDDSAFSNRGLFYWRKASYDRAIQDYGQVIRLNPSDDAFNNRGLVYFGKTNYDRAIQDFDQAIRLNPSYAIALNNRGLSKRKIGDTTGGDADIAKAKQLDPKLRQ